MDWAVVIATDIARQQLEYEEHVDVVDIVPTMRKDRGGMISKKNNIYLFIRSVNSASR